MHKDNEELQGFGLVVLKQNTSILTLTLFLKTVTLISKPPNAMTQTSEPHNSLYNTLTQTSQTLPTHQPTMSERNKTCVCRCRGNNTSAYLLSRGVFSSRTTFVIPCGPCLRHPSSVPKRACIVPGSSREYLLKLPRVAGS